ncbi:MAG: hypothetical protein ACP5QI_07610 [Candidatus Bathyarchaeia archaeon]
MMVVLVRLRIKTKYGREATVPAIANAGFESDQPEVMVPREVATSLGLRPRLLSTEATAEEYRGASGRRFKAYVLKYGFAKAWVITEDREVGPTDIVLSVAYGERDVLMSDRAIDALNLVLLKPGAGIWKFSDDPPEKLRESVKLR